MCLIICPASVVSNWLLELNKWGYFLVELLGNQNEAEIAIQKAKTGGINLIFVKREIIESDYYRKL